ncbi:MAG TPA: hypothetical protein VF230_13585 [Acidimicrobiales bacterium]
MAGAFVAFMTGAPAAFAQSVPTTPPTTATPTTAAPTTVAPTTAAPTTEAPATTGAPASTAAPTTGPATTKRTTTTKPPTTTTPDQLPTLPVPQTAAPVGGATTSTTTDLDTVSQDASVNPLFPTLSVVGFVTAVLIVAVQWFLTRRPGRPTL